MGYHKAKIKKGEKGELSKVREEMEEALDAKDQGCELMVLMELSDVIGAISLYLEKYHPSLKMNDLIKMAELTKSAFRDGDRT
jgi:phosphoribosyl-ATP pyrophosphohydrolase